MTSRNFDQRSIRAWSKFRTVFVDVSPMSWYSQCLSECYSCNSSPSSEMYWNLFGHFPISWPHSIGWFEQEMTPFLTANPLNKNLHVHLGLSLLKDATYMWGAARNKHSTIVVSTELCWIIEYIWYWHYSILTFNIFYSCSIPLQIYTFETHHILQWLNDNSTQVAPWRRWLQHSHWARIAWKNQKKSCFKKIGARFTWCI